MPWDEFEEGKSDGSTAYRCSRSLVATARAGARGAAGQRQHRRHHRPQRPAQPDRRLRLAGGHLHCRHADLQRRHPGPVLRTRPPPTRRSASPSSSSSTANRRPLEKPVGELKTVRVDLPVGLSVNPGATAALRPRHLRSRRRQLPTRSARSATATVTAADPLVGIPLPIPPAAVYNIKPPDRRTGPLRARTARQRNLPQGRRRLGRRLPRGLHDRRPRKPWNCRGWKGLILKNRLVFDGTAGDGTFITTPSTCLGEGFPGPSGHVYSTYLLAASYAEEESAGYQFPRDAAPALRVADPARDLAQRMRIDPLRPVAGGQPGHAGDRLARRRQGRRRRAAHPRRRQTGQLRHPHRPGRAAGRDGAEPLGRRRPADLHRRPVPQAEQHPRHRLPGRLQGRHGDDRIAAAARRRAGRQRLRRQAAQPRPGLRRRVPDLHRRRVQPLRDLGAAARQGQRRPARPGS